MPATQEKILAFLPKQPHQLKIAHITTASHVAPDTTFVDKDKAAMKSCGFSVTDFSLENLNPSTIFKTLNNFDIIYVQGGNGFYLLKHARNCGFRNAILKILEDSSKWYIGVSAGSYIACPTIEMHNWKAQKDQYGLDDVTAMNLVPFLVVAHYNREKYREKLSSNIPTANHPVRILTDDQALVIRNNDTVLIGSGPEILASSLTND